MFRNVLERAVSCLVILGLSIESFVIIRNILDYQAYLFITGARSKLGSLLGLTC